MLAKHALSQLSYSPKGCRRQAKEASKRRKPGAARRAPDKAAKTLYRPFPAAWWAWEDLNLRPHAYQARALTN